MDTRLVLNSMYSSLEMISRQFLQSLEGIPDEDLISWKPSAEQHGGGEMNTFAALAVHVVEAAGWRIRQQVFDIPYPREREREFHARATRAEIDEMFASLLSGFRHLIESDTVVELNELPTTIREDHPNRTRLDWLVSSIEHTALHLGHAQIQRQLWLAERVEH